MRAAWPALALVLYGAPVWAQDGGVLGAADAAASVSPSTVGTDRNVEALQARNALVKTALDDLSIMGLTWSCAQGLGLMTGRLAFAVRTIRGRNQPGTARRISAGPHTHRKTFQVGDRVNLEGYYGEVTSIGLRAVRLATVDDNEVTVPNRLSRSV